MLNGEQYHCIQMEEQADEYNCRREKCRLARKTKVFQASSNPLTTCLICRATFLTLKSDLRPGLVAENQLLSRGIYSVKLVR
jgi:hypothetical protein